MSTPSRKGRHPAVCAPAHSRPCASIASATGSYC